MIRISGANVNMVHWRTSSNEALNIIEEVIDGF
jgi:hypothetical protein